jgi:hypothetical protein
MALPWFLGRFGLGDGKHLSATDGLVLKNVTVKRRDGRVVGKLIL